MIINSNCGTIQQVLDKDFLMINSIIFSSLFEQSIHYNKIFRFATEDICSYMTAIPKIDTYLTVCGSGDQVINGILLGAKEIDTFDINYFAKYGLLLKIAAIKTLTKEEFIQAYQLGFNLNDIYKMLQVLPDDEVKMLVNILKMYGIKYLNRIFLDNKVPKELFIKINNYLQDNNYDQLKSMLDNVTINFIEADFYHILDYICGKRYDFINLSNIYEYINYDSGATKEKAQEYYQYIEYLMNSHLNGEGSLLLVYMYKWSKHEKERFLKLYNQEKILVGRYDKKSKIGYYQKGLTYQNLSYAYLYDVMEEKKYEEVFTNTVIFGNSLEREHDVAIVLRKEKYGNNKNND